MAGGTQQYFTLTRITGHQQKSASQDLNFARGGEQAYEVLAKADAVIKNCRLKNIRSSGFSPEQAEVKNLCITYAQI